MYQEWSCITVWIAQEITSLSSHHQQMNCINLIVKATYSSRLGVVVSSAPEFESQNSHRPKPTKPKRKMCVWTALNRLCGKASLKYKQWQSFQMDTTFAGRHKGILADRDVTLWHSVLPLGLSLWQKNASVLVHRIFFHHCTAEMIIIVYISGSSSGSIGVCHSETSCTKAHWMCTFRATCH